MQELAVAIAAFPYFPFHADLIPCTCCCAEGLAVATVLAARGASPRRLLLWTTLTALPQALVALPSFLFVEAFAALLPLAMGFAAGCMVWIVAAELLPDALEGLPHPTVATAVTAAAAW